MPDFTDIAQIDALLADADGTTNHHGNITRDMFLEGGKRYLFDTTAAVRVLEGPWEPQGMPGGRLTTRSRDSIVERDRQGPWISRKR